jgi:hypothetical protein
MAMSGEQLDSWVDAEIRRVDPYRQGLGGAALDAALAGAGQRILASAGQGRGPRRRRLLRAPRRLALVGVVVLGASGVAAASGVFVNANTHTYNHGWQHIAGGPGENITGAGTNFVQVVRKESAGAGIVFPSTYANWRTHEIRFTRSILCGAGHAHGGHQCAQESTGMLNVNLAQDAFCTWVLAWRQAKLSHDPTEARQAANVIAGVLRWKAATDIRYIPGEFRSSFAWMRPYMRAVATNDLRRVDGMLASQGVSQTNAGGSWFWFFDPGFSVKFDKLLLAARSHVPAGKRSIVMAREKVLVDAEGAMYTRYIETRRS